MENFERKISENDEEKRDVSITSDVERTDIKTEIQNEYNHNERLGDKRNPNLDNLKVEDLTDADLVMWQKVKEWLGWVNKFDNEDNFTEEDKIKIKEIQEDFRKYTNSAQENENSVKLRAYLHDKLWNKGMNVLYFSV